MPASFDKILIANRGEIAVRVIRTARAMGISTVAVFSDADETALHVDMADEAVRIGPAPAGDSYLKAEAIIAAAQRTGAQAVHPGYGFLSENASFAEALDAAGLVFIGPPAEAIAKMGLKDEAKRLMALADVPVVPGYLGQDQAPDRLAKEAKAIGYPILIKAVAGGGGKGMRRVDSEKEFPAALKAARREAAGAFGNEQVLIEKYLLKPRHIEVQVFADDHRGAVYLFERDCSLQRRHQKVVEEAPAPGMPEDLRERMGEAAVAAARTIGYRGAGTVEFIVDVADSLENAPFYFMEMNTRLQVEHPVTEMITGEDLVEWQIRVAAGEPLPLRQDDLDIDGHAIEVRLYAEDPARDFLPATGTLDRFSAPFDSDFTRVDTGVREGDRVTVHYDPMLAKLIAWGEDRPAALEHLRHALARTEVAGLATNLDFLRRAVAHDAFAQGDVDTGFIARHADALMPVPAGPSHEAVLMAALGVLAAREERAVEMALASGDPYSPWHSPSAWRPNLPSEETQRFADAQGAEHAVAIAMAAGGYRLTHAGRDFEARLRALGEDGGLEAEIDGRTWRATVLAGQEAVTVILDGRTAGFKRLSAKFDPEDEAEGPGAVLAPMPGKVLEVLVAEGDAVERGQPLLILEAMKMEHTLTAPRAGTVSQLGAEAGAQVSEGAVLVTVDA